MNSIFNKYLKFYLLLDAVYLMAILRTNCVVINKKNDLLADSILFNPSYHSYAPAEDVGSSYKKYDDDSGSYAKYSKHYGDTGYKHYENKDNYHDQGYDDHTLNKYLDYSSHDKYGSKDSHYGNKYGNNVYTRDRGYGYEKHYAYDKELSTKSYNDEHSDKASSYGDHGKHQHSALYAQDSSGHLKSGDSKKYSYQGHNKYGHSKGSYGNHDRHYGSMGKNHHITTPYTHYSHSPSYSKSYEPSVYEHQSTLQLPTYPAYKPDIYQQQYNEAASSALHPSSAVYEPIQATYISHRPVSYPSASISYASVPANLHSPGVAYY